MKKGLLLFSFMMLLWIWNPPASQAAAVYWDGMELKEGQVGRVTITKPINLWERTEKGLEFERVLHPGEKYRVYRMDQHYGGQFGVGGNFYITNIKGFLKYETPSSSKRELVNCNVGCLVNHVIKTEAGSAQQNDIEKIKNRLAKLPEGLLLDLITNKVELHLITGLITETDEYAYLKGKTPRGWEGTGKTWDDIPGLGGGKNVFVRLGYSEKGSGHGSVNLELHELAHSIDSILKKNISYSTEFLNIWKKERYALFEKQPYMTQFSEEFFAEAFAMFYVGGSHSKTLQNKAPLTYQFMKKLY